MPELTIGRMAKLYGLHRSTLYEAVEKGRVTTGFNGKGQRVIDLSEMIRVYGEPPGKTQSRPTDQTPSPDTAPTPDGYRELVEELRDLRREVKELREVMLRLPSPQSADHPPGRPTKPVEGDPAPTPTDDDPHGLRALVRAMRRSEQK